MFLSFRKLGLIFQVIFLAFLFYFALRLILYHFNLVTFPYPNTFREGAMMTSTEALVHGHNPYDMALQPQYTNTYGIVYPLLVWPWAKLFGITMIVHRAVTAFFIIASCALVFFVMQRMQIPLLLNLGAVLMFYASLLYPETSTPCIDPGATGTYLFLLTIFIPWSCKYSYRSLMLSIVCGILAYYTKPYCVLGIPVMISYLFLFISKRKGIIYGTVWLVVMVISVILMNNICQAYFDNCFFGTVNSTAAWSSVERLYYQIDLYSSIHKWILILIGVIILGYGYQLFNSKGIKYIKDHIVQLFLRIKLRDLNEPFIKLNFPIWAYAGLCSSFVLYVSLGRHTGATLWYFFQLLSPFFLIGSAWLFSRLDLWPLVCIPFLVLNLYTLTTDEDYKYFSKDAYGWSDISRLINEGHHILNITLIAPLLIEEGKQVFDNGSTENFGQGGARSRFFKMFFKEDPQVIVQQIMFFDNIRSMVENKEFDLIILQPNLMPMGVGDDIRKYYKFEGLVTLYTPQDRRLYSVTAWLPLRDIRQQSNGF